jgi:hypothetical protein
LGKIIKEKQMVKRNFVWVFFYVLLVFGMIFVGCDNGTTNGNGNEDGNTDPKTISLNGFTKSDGDYSIYLSSNRTMEEIVAVARFTFSNGAASIPLKIMDGDGLSETNWNGNGDYYIRIQEWNAGDSTQPITTKNKISIVSPTTSITYNVNNWE